MNKEFKKIIKVVILGLVAISCSNLNRESQDFYYGKDPMRHGIVPIVSTHTKNLAPRDMDAEKRGLAIYKVSCYNCHGAKADGNGPISKDQPAKPADLVAMAKKVPNFKFFMLISKWKGDMPGWKSLLSEKEMRDVEKYIMSLARN